MIIDRKKVFDIFRLNDIREIGTQTFQFAWTSVEAEYDDAREMVEYLTATPLRKFFAKEAENNLEANMRASRLIGFELSCFLNCQVPKIRLLFENGKTSNGSMTVIREIDTIRNELAQLACLLNEH